jgi:hypothetical protein
MAPCSLYSSSVYGYGRRWCSSWKRRWGGIGSRAVGMWKKTGSLPPSVWEAHHPDVPTHALGPDRRLAVLCTCTWAIHVTNTYSIETKKKRNDTHRSNNTTRPSQCHSRTQNATPPWVSFSFFRFIHLKKFKLDTKQLNIIRVLHHQVFVLYLALKT